MRSSIKLDSKHILLVSATALLTELSIIAHCLFSFLSEDLNSLLYVNRGVCYTWTVVFVIRKTVVFVIRKFYPVAQSL
jgi:hypothetical protein